MRGCGSAPFSLLRPSSWEGLSSLWSGSIPRSLYGNLRQCSKHLAVSATHDMAIVSCSIFLSKISVESAKEFLRESIVCASTFPTRTSESRFFSADMTSDIYTFTTQWGNASSFSTTWVMSLHSVLSVLSISSEKQHPMASAQASPVLSGCEHHGSLTSIHQHIAP